MKTAKLRYDQKPVAPPPNHVPSLERSFQVLEYLAARPQGQSLSALSDELRIPRGARHRLLADLVQFGYVRQIREHGEYALTTACRARPQLPVRLRHCGHRATADGPYGRASGNWSGWRSSMASG